MSEKGVAYVEFWRRFLERIHADHPDWTSGKTASSDNWYEMKGPRAGCRYSFGFAWFDRLRHELYIDTGYRAPNTAIYEQLLAQRPTIEAAYGSELSWEELPKKRACRIADYKDVCSVLDRNRHDQYIDWFIDAAVRL